MPINAKNITIVGTQPVNAPKQEEKRETLSSVKERVRPVPVRNENLAYEKQEDEKKDKKASSAYLLDMVTIDEL